MNKKKGILLWFLILLCVQVQYDLALVDLHILENKVPSFQLIAHKQQGKCSTDNVHMHGEDHGEYVKTNCHAIGMEKARRGKGSYGGANVVHKRPEAKSAASVLRSPFGFILTTNVCIGLSLLLILPLLIA